MSNKQALSKALRQRIIDLSKEKNITIHKLSLKSGIAYSTISSFLTGRCTSITISTLHKICKGLDISLKEFFDSTLFNEIIKNKTIY